MSLSPQRPTTAEGPLSSYFTWSVRAGGSVSNAVVVTNSTAAAQQLAVSAVDGFTAQASGASYEDLKKPRTDSASWVRLSQSSVTVPAHKSVAVPFTVRVPAGATPGDHLAGLVFQNVETSSSQSGPLQVTTVGRSVIGALVQVTGPAAIALRVTGARISRLPASGPVAVYVSLSDVGRLLARPVMTVSLRSSSYSRTVKRQLDTLLPGDPISYPFRWPEALKPGTYEITVQLSGLGVPATTFYATSSIDTELGTTRVQPAETAPDAAPVTSKGLSTGFVIGVAVAAALAALAAVALVLAVLRRRRA